MNIGIIKTDPLHKAGLKVVRLLKKERYEAYWVGGVVRDLLLGKDSDNLDIATSAKPETVQGILESAGIKTKEIGKQFGTILAIAYGQKIEITTFRSEGYYSDRRHPDKVEFISDYKKDALRRDFTINAIYLDALTGNILDPVNGQKDIKAKLIRFVGKPKKRIDEDHLRMLRAVRFAATIDFKLEKNTFAAIKTRAKLIQGVSGERIKQELDKILSSKNRVQGIRLLDELGLLKFIMPEISALKNIFHKSKKYHLEGSVFEHTMLVLGNIKADTAAAYSAIFHDSGKLFTGKPKKKDEGWVVSFHGHEKVSTELFLKFANRLHFPKHEIKLIAGSIINHMYWPIFEKMRPSKQIRLALNPNFAFWIELWKADQNGNLRLQNDGSVIAGRPTAYKSAKRLLEVIESKTSLIERLASGDEVKEIMGLKEGPKVGNIIRSIKEKIITGRIKNKNDLNKFLENPID